MRELIRWFRLQRATWAIRWRTCIERIQSRYERATCPHSWRPARVNGNAGRFCKICECAESMTTPDFYAAVWGTWAGDADRYGSRMATGTAADSC